MKDNQINCHTSCSQIKDWLDSTNTLFSRKTFGRKFTPHIYSGSKSKPNFSQLQQLTGELSQHHLDGEGRQGKDCSSTKWWSMGHRGNSPLAVLFCFSMKTPHCLLTEILGVSVANSSIQSFIMLCWTGERKGPEKEQARTVLQTGEQMPFRDQSRQLSGGGC